MVDFLSQLSEYEGDSVEQFMRDLYNAKNIEMKTELINPMAVSLIEMMIERAKQEHCTRLAAVMTALVGSYKLNMVSYKRGGRGEAERMVSGLVSRDYEMKDKLLGKEQK